MAVFTAIASAIVTAIGVSTATIVGSLTWAGLATSVIAGGLALATAKVLGVFKPPNMQSQKDPGVKVQLPPATDNKIPVFYGRNITGGIITDAGISNQNQTMTYVIIIGEHTDSGTYTVNKVYRDDQELVFGTSSGDKHIVQSVIDSNATASNKVAGKMRCRVYAGGTASTDQIFPGAGATKVAATTMLSTITGSTSYDGLVYAVFQIDYDQEENLFGLGAINFDITNSLSEPSNVLLDYLQNSRYGAGISSGDLDTTSFNDLYDYSTTQVAYTTSAGAGDTHDRWSIDGMLSTYVPVKDNIDQLCQSCSAFFTYNPKNGKFGVVPNRAATTAEKTAAFQFNDDNILGPISVTSTDLYGLYNEIEAEYPQVAQKDQTDIVFVTTPSGSRNTNEPDNKLSTRYNLVNDNSRVHNLANIDLKQSRLSTVVEFDADYSAIQVDSGDIFKLTNSEYGFSDKLFRVMRVVEQETETGMLGAKVIGLEYADSVYDHSNVQSKGVLAATGIPSYGVNLGNSSIDLGNVYIVDDGDSGNANVVDPDTGNNVDVLPPDLWDFPIFQGGYNPFIGIDYTLPNGVFYDTLELEVTPVGVDTTGTVNPTVYTYKPPMGETFFDANNQPQISIPIQGLGINDLGLANVDKITMSLRGKDSITGISSLSNTTANLTVSTKNYIPKESLTTFTSGVQFEDTPATNTSIANGTTFLSIQPSETYDLRGAEAGDYSLQSFGSLGGTITGAFDVGFGHAYELTFANATASNIIGFTSTVQTVNITDFPPQLTMGSKISTDVADYVTAYPAYNFSSDMVATQVEIGLIGYSDIGTSGPGPRAFGALKYEMLHVTKGEKTV